MENKLKEITYLTLKQLKKENIILPSKYSKLFEENAKKLEFDLDNDSLVFKNLQQDSDSLDEVVKKTSEKLTSLQDSTQKAKEAIVNNDVNTLNTINKELERMQKQIDFLQKELFSDALTDAYNRKWFMDTYLRDDVFIHNGFMAFLDLNNFKIINDTYGHIIGDQVLKYLVNFLKKELNLPGVDIVRYAGDEFIVVFNKDKSTILNPDKKMEKAQKKLAEQKLKSSKIKSLKFSFSYGLVPFKKGDEFESSLDEVDELMYQNKKRIKNKH
ncbi:MAG: GGDEF domain-containing protein [Campylobacteraceae bacterium]|nr:GGDEF domain-containing protein [Campylobacteraceae bacterium]